MALGGPAQQHTFHLPGDVDRVAFSATSGQRDLFEASAFGGIRRRWRSMGRTASRRGNAAARPDGGGSETTSLSWVETTPAAYHLRIGEAHGLGGAGARDPLRGSRLLFSAYLPHVEATGNGPDVSPGALAT